MDQKQIELAIELLSKKMNIPKENLRKKVQSGDISDLLSSAAGQEILKDKKKMEALMSNPQVISFLKKMLKEGN